MNSQRTDHLSDLCGDPRQTHQAGAARRLMKKVSRSNLFDVQWAMAMARATAGSIRRTGVSAAAVQPFIDSQLALISPLVSKRLLCQGAVLLRLATSAVLVALRLAAGLQWATPIDTSNGESMTIDSRRPGTVSRILSCHSLRGRSGGDVAFKRVPDSVLFGFDLMSISLPNFRKRRSP